MNENVEVQAMLDRITTLAAAGLRRNPHADRAIEMLEQGGQLFCRSVGLGRFEFSVGWYADPRLRPPDVDPFQRVVLIRDVPRRALLGTPNPADS